jgi:hypothetical protein
MNYLRTTFICLMLLGIGSLHAQVTWKSIPANDPAVSLLTLIKAGQSNYSAMPEGSTFNYIWAQNMLAWMVAERSGLMSHAECSARLSGLLNKVANWPTYHGFYYNSYNSSTGVATSAQVYFQSWWIWALILTRAGYPDAAPVATTILSRFDYEAAGMVTADKKGLVADRYTDTNTISFNFYPTGDISGELRTAFIAYTWLTGDVTPWQITSSNAFITVGGQQLLAVWHNFTFDPFYVHSCFPELGYFQKSYSNLITGANNYRAANGMTFYGTRMEALEAWNQDPTQWPNTEHRVAKPWTAWLTNPAAPVMDRAWIASYGLTQYFDNWNFYWGYGAVSSTAHAKVVGSAGSVSHGVFAVPFELETLPGSVTPVRPPRLMRVVVNALPDPSNPPSAPLLIRVNGSIVGQLNVAGATSLTSATTVNLTSYPTLQANNTLRLETSGSGAWLLGQTASTFRKVQWLDDTHAAAEVSAIGLTIYVDGQRAARENPFAFLCRAGGAFGNYPWKILAQYQSAEFGRKQVAWIGSYSAAVQYAHVIYNVSTSSIAASYTLSPWESGKQWKVVDYANQSTVISSTQSTATLTWNQAGRQTVLITEK